MSWIFSSHWKNLCCILSCQFKYNVTQENFELIPFHQNFLLLVYWIEIGGFLWGEKGRNGDTLVWVWCFFAFLPVCCQSLIIHNGYAKCNQPFCSPYSQLRVDKISFSFRSVKVVAWSVPCLILKALCPYNKVQGLQACKSPQFKKESHWLQACPWTTRIKASKPVQVAIKNIGCNE